jgi:hypothetical protein
VRRLLNLLFFLAVFCGQVNADEAAKKWVGEWQATVSPAGSDAFQISLEFRIKQGALIGSFSGGGTINGIADANTANGNWSVHGQNGSFNLTFTRVGKEFNGDWNGWNGGAVVAIKTAPVFSPENDVVEESKLTVSGFRVRGHGVDQPNPLPIKPPESVFYISEGGFPSLNLDSDLFRRSFRIKIAMWRDESEISEQTYANNSVSDLPRIPYQSSEDRVVTINLFDVIQEDPNIGFDQDLFSAENYRIRTTLISRTGRTIKEIDSPRVSIYDRLSWINQRIDYLSRQLFKRHYDAIADWPELNLIKRLWRLFADAGHYQISFIAANYSSSKIDGESAVLYAIMQKTDESEGRLHHLQTYTISLDVLDQLASNYELTAASLNVDQLSQFQGLILTNGEQSSIDLPAEKIFASKFFTIEAESPARNASQRIASAAAGNLDYLSAANQFLSLDAQTLDESERQKVQASQQVVRTHRALFDEFLALIERRDTLFEASDVGRLNSLMTDEYEDVNLRFGIWIPEPNPDNPSMRSPGWVLPGWDHHEIDLEVSAHEMKMRTLGTFVTMGLSQGDIPISEQSALAQLKRLQDQASGSDIDRWLSHNRIPDGYFQMDASERRAFFQKVAKGHPFNHVKGELFEGLMSRQIAGGLVDDVAQKYKDFQYDTNSKSWVPRQTNDSSTPPSEVKYYPGWDIRHRWKDADGNQVHQQGNDGLVVVFDGEGADRKMLVHDILEAKSGSQIKQGQIPNHQFRINNYGLHFVDPSPEKIAEIKNQLGIDPTVEKIGKRDTTVIHIPKDRVHVIDSPDLNHLVTSADIFHNVNNVAHHQVREKQRAINDFSDQMMRMANDFIETEMRKVTGSPLYWNDPTMDLRDYRRFYQDLPIPDKNKVSASELDQRFLSGQRADEAGRWHRIYFRETELLDPYISEDAYIEKMKKYRPGFTEDNIKSARNNFRRGQRWDVKQKRYSKGVYQPDPHGYQTIEEHRHIASTHRQAGLEIASLLEQRRAAGDSNLTQEKLIEKIYDEGKRFDIGSQKYMDVLPDEAIRMMTRDSHRRLLRQNQQARNEVSNRLKARQTNGETGLTRDQVIDDIYDARERFDLSKNSFVDVNPPPHVIENNQRDDQPRKRSRLSKAVDSLTRTLDRFDRDRGGINLDDKIERRRAFRNSVGDGLGDLLQAASAASVENARLQEKKIRVKMAKKFGTAYMIVMERQRENGEFRWVLAGSPARQASILKQYLLNSGTAWRSMELPEWFKRAVSDIPIEDKASSATMESAQ